MGLKNIIIQQQRLHQLEKEEFIRQFSEFKKQQADKIQDLLQSFNASLDKVKQLNNITVQFPRPELQQVQRITQLQTENAQLKISTKQQQQQIMQIRNEYKRFVDEVVHKHSSSHHDTFVTQSDEDDQIDQLLLKQQLHIDSATQLSLQLLTKTISEMQGQFIQQDNEIHLLNKQVRELRTQCEKFGQQCDMQQMEIDQLQWQNKKLLTQLDKTHLLNQIDELQEKNMEITIEYQKQQQELLSAYTQLSTMKQIIDNSSIQAKQQINEALKLYESTKIGELQNQLIQQIEDSIHFSKMYKIAHDLMMKKEDINMELRIKIYRYFNFNEHFIDQARHYTEQQFQMYIQTLQDRILLQQTQINSLQSQNNIFNNQIVAVQKENFSLQQENKLLATTSSSMNKSVSLNNNQILQEKTAELQRRKIYSLQEQNDQLKKQNSELNEKYETEKITRNSQMLNLSLLCDLYKIMYVKLKYQDISKDLNQFVIKQIDKLSMGKEINYFVPPKIIEDLLKAEINIYDFIEKNKYIREALLQQKTSLKMNQQVIDAMIKLRLNDQRIHVTKGQSSYIEQCLDNITNTATVVPQEQQSSVIFQDVKSREGNTEKLVIFKQSANIPLTLSAVMSCGMLPLTKWDTEVQVGESIIQDAECQTDKIEEPPVIQPEPINKIKPQKESKKNLRQVKPQNKQVQKQKQVHNQINQQQETKIQNIEQTEQQQQQQNIQNIQIEQHTEVPIEENQPIQQVEQQVEEFENSISSETSSEESNLIVVESKIIINEENVPITIKKVISKPIEEQNLSETDLQTKDSKINNNLLNEQHTEISQYNSSPDVSQYQNIVKSVIETADIEYQGQRIVVIDEKKDITQQSSGKSSQFDDIKNSDDDQIIIKIKNDGIQATISHTIQLQYEPQAGIIQKQEKHIEDMLTISQSQQQKEPQLSKLHKQPSKQCIQEKQEKVYDQEQQQKNLYNNIIKAQGLFITDEQQEARQKLLQPTTQLSRESTIEEQSIIYQQVQLLQKGLKSFDIVANINKYNETKEQKDTNQTATREETNFSTIKLEKDEENLQHENNQSLDESLYIQSITHNYSLMDINQVLINQLMEADRYIIHQKQQIDYFSRQLMMAQEELHSTKLNYITKNYKVSNIDTIISQKINNNIELLRAQYYSQYDLFAQIFIEIQSQITFIANKMARLDLLKLINGLDMRLQEVNIKILQVKKRELHQRQQISKFIKLIKKFGKLSDKVYEQMDSKQVLNLLLDNPDQIEQILIDSAKNPETLQNIQKIQETKNYSNLENLSEQQININDIDIIDSISEVEADKQQQEIDELEQQIQLQTKQLEHVQTHFEENHQKQVEQASHFMAQTVLPSGLQQYKEQMEKRMQNLDGQLKPVVETADKEIQAVQQHDSLQYTYQQRDSLLEESQLQQRILSELDSNITINIQQMQDQINDTVDIKQKLNRLNKPGVNTRTPSPGQKGRKNSFSMDQYKWQQNNNLLDQIKNGLINIIAQSQINQQDECMKIFIKQLSSVIDLLRQSNMNNSILANKIVTMETDFNIMKLSLHEQLEQMKATQKMQDQNAEHQLLEIMFGPGPRPQTEARKLSAAGLRPSRHKWRR